MARSDRLLRLMQCLRTARPPVTAAFLADELEVSIRTLYRDIETLRSSGALIDGEAGVGYTLQEDPALPPMLFSRDEMEALVLGLREVREVGDPVLSNAAENALSKLKASLPPRMQAEFEHAVLYAKRYIQRPSVQIDIQTLRQETREERILTIDYVDEHQATTQRDICPLAIVYFEKSLVLLAWCDLRSDFRMFRIDRIQHMTPTGTSFRPKRVPMLRNFLARLSEESD